MMGVLFCAQSVPDYAKRLECGAVD
ncbi:MAG: hypothetical protein QOH21_3354, partial [Acidobacteriota bacterium]|nr:hypothetical protein [Acidobacteriota bacterium]